MLPPAAVNHGYLKRLCHRSPAPTAAGSGVKVCYVWGQGPCQQQPLLVWARTSNLVQGQGPYASLHTTDTAQAPAYSLCHPLSESPYQANRPPFWFLLTPFHILREYYINFPKVLDCQWFSKCLSTEITNSIL